MYCCLCVYFQLVAVGTIDSWLADGCLLTTDRPTESAFVRAVYLYAWYFLSNDKLCTLNKKCVFSTMHTQMRRVRPNGHQYFRLSLARISSFCCCFYYFIRSVRLVFLYLCVYILCLYVLYVSFGVITEQTVVRTIAHTSNRRKRTETKRERRRKKAFRCHFETHIYRVWISFFGLSLLVLWQSKQ